MDAVPKIGLGEFYRELRRSRLVKQKDVVGGDFTAAQLSRFESGKSMLAADKLITAVEGINMTMEEFTYKYHGYKEAAHIELANLISDLYYRQDRDELEALLESDLLKAEGNLYARLNGIVIKVALAALDGQSDFDDEDREFLSDYLFAIEEWTSFELYLFLNAQMLLNNRMLLYFAHDLCKEEKSFNKLRKHQELIKSTLLNTISELFDRGIYSQVSYYLDKMESMISFKDTFVKIMARYYRLLLDYIENGRSDKEKEIIETYIQSIQELIDDQTASIIRVHFLRFES
ncbi:TPA: Rgg/GadR/MutR family transcriptional regulator [Streptococcus suis]|uniref:Rgg/GadR/MutR family transcriptional regulator n=1 Tax=Streptococcus sp. A23 TaxID=3373127 RepID=UPI003706BCCC